MKVLQPDRDVCDPALSEVVFPPACLAPGGVHEITTARGEGFASSMAGFASLLLAKVAPAGPVFWTASQPDLSAPGLAWLGLDPARVIFAPERDDRARLAALEIALAGGLHGVIEAGALSRLAARRLARAARQGGGIGFLLRAGPPSDSTACATRWRIAPAPSARMEAPRWRAELLHARGIPPMSLLLEADCHATPPVFTVVAGLADPAVDPIRRRAVG